MVSRELVFLTFPVFYGARQSRDRVIRREYVGNMQRGRIWRQTESLTFRLKDSVSNPAFLSAPLATPSSSGDFYPMRHPVRRRHFSPAQAGFAAVNKDHIRDLTVVDGFTKRRRST